MDTNLETADQESSRPISSLSVLGARLTWSILGPVVLLGIAWGIVSQGTGWLTGLDATFGIIVALMLLGRWVEHRSGAATTLTGERTTPEQFKRYVTRLPLLAAAVWIVANVVGNYVLK
jgi:hypothetical protein